MNTILHKRSWSEPQTIGAQSVVDALSWASTCKAERVDILSSDGKLARVYYRALDGDWYESILNGKPVIIQAKGGY